MAEDVIRAALFLDFDNVYGALFEIEREKADLFGRRPEVWLRFFADGRHDGRTEYDLVMGEDVQGDPPLGRSRGSSARRLILMRQCYLNPDGRAANDRTGHSFSQYRNSFVEAGFSVIDCPNLTTRGKNAADIKMALDIVDAIGHPTRFDEFIVLAVDSDMTPVLVRLREHDRRSAVFATRKMSRAYRSVCDMLVGDIDFINRALGAQTIPPAATADRVAPLRPEAQPDLLQQVAREVASYAQGQGPIPIRRTVPALSKFAAFSKPLDGKKWFGYGSMNALFLELAKRDETINLEHDANGYMLIRVDGPLLSTGAVRDQADNELQQRLLEFVDQELSKDPEGILLSRLGIRLRQLMPELPPKGWPGGIHLKDLFGKAPDKYIVFNDQNGHPLVASAMGRLGPQPSLGSNDEPLMGNLPSQPAALAGDHLELSTAVATGADALAEMRLRDRLISYIRGLLENEDQPVGVGELERLVLAQNDVSNWPDAANFAEFARRQGFDFLPVAAGFIYDRTKHEPFAIRLPGPDGADIFSAPCDALIELVTRNTRCPALPPEAYRKLFHAIATVSRDHGEHLVQASRDPAMLPHAITKVEELLSHDNVSVPAGDIAYVLDALRHSDAMIKTSDEDSALGLADAFAAYLEAVCGDNRLILTSEERTLLRLWLGVDQIDAGR